MQDRIDGRRPHAGRGYAAAPHEHLLAPRIVSTIFPHLPRAGADTFRALLLLGAAVLFALSLAGLFPVALIVAAILVPLLVVTYLREADVFEDEPVRVMVFTAAWGAAAGAGVGFLANAARSPDAGLAVQTTPRAVLWSGVLVPLIGFVLALAGPVVLLRYRKFNDVLDGITFGACSAIVFGGAELLVHSSTFLSAGVRPPGLVTPWALRLVTLGVAVPVLVASAVGSAAGALWLHYRAPRRDRGRLGPLGYPVVALPLRALLLVGAALAQLYLNRWASLGVVLALDAAALVWLRVMIHAGLLEEAAEKPVGPPVTCANCGLQTPSHTFCAHCGISLRALPKSGRPHLPEHRRRLAIAFGAVLIAVLGLAAGVMEAVAPGSAAPPCPTSAACASPPVLPVEAQPSGPSRKGATWASSLGVTLGYDPAGWRVVSTGGSAIQLTHDDDLALRVEASAAAGTTPERLLNARVDALRGRYPDLELDPDPAHQPASGAIGSVAGIGEAFAGHDSDGYPVEVLVDAASAHGIAVVVSAWTSQQAHTSADGHPTAFDGMAYADSVLERLHWPFERVSTGVRQR